MCASAEEILRYTRITNFKIISDARSRFLKSY